MNRRHFIASATAFGAAALGTFAQTPAASASLKLPDPASLQQVPPSFMGLSYESAQLANPAFFSPANKSLIALFRELTPQGVLRLGGGSSEYTTFAEKPPTGPSTLR